MPRPNRERSVGAEARLAARIEKERVARGWSLQRLADEYAAVGCPIAVSALHKNVHGDPPRRIVVDEAVAAAAVFNIPLERLIQ